MGFINQLITGGHHPVLCLELETPMFGVHDTPPLFGRKIVAGLRPHSIEAAWAQDVGSLSFLAICLAGEDIKHH